MSAATQTNRKHQAFDDRRFADAIANAVDALGRATFYERLLDLVAIAAPHELAAMVRYSKDAPPDLILPDLEHTEPILAYLEYFYALDPFYAHWKNRGETGVFRLRGMDEQIDQSRYSREFLTAMEIYDEIAVFLPPLGDASPTLLLDRATRPFGQREVARVKRLYPIISSLHQQHLSIFVANGIDAEMSPVGGKRALRLLDRAGRQLFATKAWVDLVSTGDRSFDDALAIVAARGPCSMALSGQRRLRRTQLPSDFGPAPAGLCDEVRSVRNLAYASLSDGLPPGLSDRLTSREQDVVLLTLSGYPIIDVARRLGLSRGTVKNHRLNIYRKLDITTERELFGEYLEAIRSAG